MTEDRVGVLFVCLGNICRSPMAQGALEHRLRALDLAPRVRVDSAGTHPYHVGQPPDERAQRAALARGMDISAQRARQVEIDDYRRFDYVIAMDRDNYQALQYVCPRDRLHVLHLCLDFAPSIKRVDVPDPFFGHGTFEEVLDMLESACEGVIEELRLGHWR